MTERRTVVIESETSFFARVRQDVERSRKGVRHDGGATHSFETFSAAIVHRWLPELMAATGRTEADLQANGLGSGMFNFAGVRVDFDDGSAMHFKHAFALRSPADDGLVAIFTEHCGHYEIELGMYDKLEVAAPLSAAAGISEDRSDPSVDNQPLAGQ
jgi:hypothetical protein